MHRTSRRLQGDYATHRHSGKRRCLHPHFGGSCLTWLDACHDPPVICLDKWDIFSSASSGWTDAKGSSGSVISLIWLGTCANPLAHFSETIYSLGRWNAHCCLQAIAPSHHTPPPSRLIFSTGLALQTCGQLPVPISNQKGH
jgi:hypothetical protein